MLDPDSLPEYAKDVGVCNAGVGRRAPPARGPGASTEVMREGGAMPLSEDQLRHYQDHGFLIVEGLLTPDDLPTGH